MVLLGEYNYKLFSYLTVTEAKLLILGICGKNIIQPKQKDLAIK